MARKTREESQLTRERILDAAEQVFAQHGVSSATIAHIADTAGVSRGAVYGHYRSKVDMCLAMCRRALQRATLPPHMLEQHPPLEALFRMGMFCLRQWLTPGSMQRALHVLYYLCEDTPENAPLTRLRRGWEADYTRQMLRALRRAVKSGDLPAALDMKLAQAFINCTMTGIYNARISGSIPPLEDWEEVERILRVTRDALCYSQHLRRTGQATGE